MQPLLAKRHWVAIIAIAVLCITVLCLARSWFANTKYTALQILPLPQAVPEFQLSGSNASAFTQKQLRGYWNLVFMGFSHCVDICPAELDVMGKVIGKLRKDDPEKNIRAVFITLDPERDTQAVLDTYVAAFNSSTNSIVGVRGSHTELAKLAHFFGADYGRQLQVNGATLNVPAGYAVPLGVTQDYQVNHSARIYLLNPSGQYVGSFPPPHNIQNMLDDLQMILKR